MSFGAQFIRMLGTVGQGVVEGLAQSSNPQVVHTPQRGKKTKKRCTPCEAIAAAQKARERARAGRL